MAASLQAAATLMQPTKVGARNNLQLRSAQSVSKAFGVEPSAARLTCSLQTEIKDLAQKCTDAAKIAGFALATSALVVSGANAEGVPKRGYSFAFKEGKYNAKKFCLEPTSFTVKAEGVSKNAAPRIPKTKLMTRLTYTLDEIEGPFEVSSDGTVKFEEKDGIDYAAVTVQLPGEVHPSLTQRTGGSTGYDNAVALPAGGRGDEEELEKENVKNASSSTGKITLSVTQSKPETGEVIGVFESIQPSDTDLGAKVPKDVKIQGVWYAQSMESFRI
ncbi:hypothetical protein HAX54_013263 [Datura stramonium]|uniref:Uncharacterized protein n=1 Tax=Datura stramonium TaxID=4076 RepID=A0ABS8TL42_DATST|nr:hypothetical protein [Datura stramonium]